MLVNGPKGFRRRRVVRTVDELARGRSVAHAPMTFVEFIKSQSHRPHTLDDGHIPLVFYDQGHRAAMDGLLWRERVETDNAPLRSLLTKYEDLGSFYHQTIADAGFGSLLTTDDIIAENIRDNDIINAYRKSLARSTAIGGMDVHPDAYCLIPFMERDTDKLMLLVAKAQTLTGFNEEDPLLSNRPFFQFPSPSVTDPRQHVNYALYMWNVLSINVADRLSVFADYMAFPISRVHRRMFWLLKEYRARFGGYPDFEVTI